MGVSRLPAATERENEASESMGLMMVLFSTRIITQASTNSMPTAPMAVIRLLSANWRASAKSSASGTAMPRPMPVGDTL